MKKKIQLLFTRLCIVLCGLPVTSMAQDQPGIRDSLYSEVLKEKRFVQVVVPPDYKPGTDAKYNVIYVLDGESNTGLVSQIQQFEIQNGFMPENIIVGIRNVNRDRDLTPTPADNPMAYGGAPRFLSFLKKELLPYIDKKYPVKGSNTIYGHSLGGLFSMYAFLNEPQLFDAYIASDPSFWWDNGYMKKLTFDKLDSTVHSNKSLWITGRGGEGTIGMGIPPIDSILRAKAPAELQWKLSEYPGETHNSIQLKGIYDGLRFFYTGYSATMLFHPMNGTVIKGKPYKVWLFSDPTGVRYTIDGTNPVKTSPAMLPGNTLPGPAQLTVKSFSSRGTYDKVMKGEFKEGTALPAIPKPLHVKQGGLHYSYFEGEWDSMPDFSKLKPVQSGFADKDFTFAKLPSKINFACLYEGYLETKEEGYYIFAVDSDDGSKFWLGKQLLINHDGLHGMGNDQSYIIYLEKGFYPVRIEYFQKGGGFDLKVIYVTPDQEVPAPVRIPPDAFYSK